MKKKYKFISLTAVLIVTAAALLYSAIAAGTNVYYDFEDEKWEWERLYNNALWDFLKEENGNTYMNLYYNGQANKDRKYFDVVAYRAEASQKLIQASYDLKYSETETARNGEIQFKNRTGSGSNQTTLVARLAKDQGYFQVQSGSGGFQRLKGIDGQYLPVEADKWYSVTVKVNLSEHWQSVYISDRDTDSLLAVYEHFPTINDIDDINMITFSSTTDMCLDNVKIGEVSCDSSYIYGSPYVKKGSKSTYYFLGKDSDGELTTLPNGTVVWSLVNAKNGVSIDENTGVLTASSSIDPGIVIIKAVKTVGDVTYEAKFAVNITN